jgi:hypothetical protein
VAEDESEDPAPPARDDVAKPARVDEVPKLPRGKGLRWVWADLFRIGFLVTLLVAVIVLRKDCAKGVATFYEAFSPPPDAGALPLVPQDLRRLTPEEIERMFPDRDAGR